MHTKRRLRVQTTILRLPNGIRMTRTSIMSLGSFALALACSGATAEVVPRTLPDPPVSEAERCGRDDETQRMVCIAANGTVRWEPEDLDAAAIEVHTEGTRATIANDEAEPLATAARTLLDAGVRAAATENGTVAISWHDRGALCAGEPIQCWRTPAFDAVQAVHDTGAIVHDITWDQWELLSARRDGPPVLRQISIQYPRRLGHSFIVLPDVRAARRTDVVPAPQAVALASLVRESGTWLQTSLVTTQVIMGGTSVSRLSQSGTPCDVPIALVSAIFDGRIRSAIGVERSGSWRFAMLNDLGDRPPQLVDAFDLRGLDPDAVGVMTLNEQQRDSWTVHRWEHVVALVPSGNVIIAHVLRTATGESNDYAGDHQHGIERYEECRQRITTSAGRLQLIAANGFRATRRPRREFSSVVYTPRCAPDVEFCFDPSGGFTSCP